jgi:hypothetical protein
MLAGSLSGAKTSCCFSLTAQLLSLLYDSTALQLSERLED